MKNYLRTVPLAGVFLAACAGGPRATGPSGTDDPPTRAVAAAPAVEQTGFGLGIDGEMGRIVVVQVAPGSPADAAGMKVGDLIVAYVGHDRRMAASYDVSLQRARELLENNATLTLGLARDGEPQLVTVELARASYRTVETKPAEPWRVGVPYAYIGVGLRFGAKTMDCYGKKDLCRVIDRVVPGSPAARAGARPGDGVRGFGGNGDPHVELRYQLRSPERAWTLRGWRNGSGGFEATLQPGLIVDRAFAFTPEQCVLPAPSVLAHEACYSGAHPTAHFDSDECGKQVEELTALRARANACVSDLSAPQRTRVEKDNAVSVARIEWLAAERQFAARGVVTGAVCSSDRLAAVACEQRTFPDSEAWVDKIVAEIGEELRLIPAHRPDPVRIALAINAWYRKLEHATRGHGGRDLVAAALAPYARLLDGSGLQAALVEAGASREVATALVIGVREARPRLDALGGDEGQRVFDAWRQHAKKHARSWARLDVIEERVRTAADSAAMLEDLDRYRDEVLTELGRTLGAFSDPRMRRATDLALDVADRVGDPARVAVERQFANGGTYLEQFVFGDGPRQPSRANPRARLMAAKPALKTPEKLGLDWTIASNRVKKIDNGRGGTATVFLANQHRASFAGSCVVVLEFIDTKGQGWGRRKCEKDTVETYESGPAQVTVPSAELGVMRKDHLARFISKPDGSGGHVLMVTDKDDRLLQLGRFAIEPVKSR